MAGLRALLLVFAFGQTADAQSCRLALVLALDVSGSVDPIEFQQQVNGLAAALDHPDVRAQILDRSGGSVSLAVFEWSSRNHQYVIQPWVTLDTPEVLDDAIARIKGHKKVRAGLKTALGTALLFAASLLEDRSACWVKTIDVSGDGENNIGLSPEQIYATGAVGQTTVNALVIGDPLTDLGDLEGGPKSDLLRYYEEKVIYGAGSFAMVARGYEDYASAMRRKLMRELRLPVLGLKDF